MNPHPPEHTVVIAQDGDQGVEGCQSLDFVFAMFLNIIYLEEREKETCNSHDWAKAKPQVQNSILFSHLDDRN